MSVTLCHLSLIITQSFILSLTAFKKRGKYLKTHKVKAFATTRKPKAKIADLTRSVSELMNTPQRLTTAS